MRLLTYWLVLVYICFLPSIISSQGYAQEFKEYVERYKASFINNPDGPLSAEDVVHLDFFPADSSYIFSCKCLDISYSPIIELSTYSGKTKQYQPYYLLECAYRDSIFSLKAFKMAGPYLAPTAHNYLFIPFKDTSNDDTTYGGGRYLSAYTTDVKNMNILLDFNKSYNPWCAYSEGFNCPIPPVSNHINVSILAGEKNYQGIHKKR